jgi:hypothetical protein
MNATTQSTEGRMKTTTKEQLERVYSVISRILSAHYHPASITERIADPLVVKELDAALVCLGRIIEDDDA